jgi:LuxR family maltose regulon positive regulatory protein
MPVTLLQTKLYRPTLRPDLIPRARLRERLYAGLWTGDAFGRKLTLIAAPAGFGKTTLILDFGFWILDPVHPKSKIKNLKSTWLSLDEADNDPARFVRYLITALQRAIPTLDPSDLALLGTGALEERLAVIINAVAATPAPVLLVLDDYHALHDPAIEPLMTFLLDHQPPNLHLVIASRVDPALPLTRLRARGHLLEVRAQDLRFTEAEAAAFLTQTMGLNLQPEWIAALEQRTEGWIAGLQLAALSLQGRDDPADFIQAFSGSHRYVIDYLVDEVLRHQPPDIRDFLVQTAILERLCGSLCDAVLDAANGQTVLEHLERANLFLIPLDDRRQWYRYHHLFADSLRATLDDAQQAALHRRAAEWFAAHNLPVDAVQHARASGDLVFIAATIERAVQQPSAWSGGQLDILVGWLDALPDAMLDEHPALTLHVSRAFHLSGRIAQSERLLERAIQALQGRDDDEARTLLAVADVYRGALAVIRGDARGAIQRVEAGLARLPESALHARARALDVLGTAHQHTGDVRQAERYFLHAGALAEASGVAYLAINARCEAAQMQMLQGRLTEAAQTCQEALRVSHTPIPPQGLAWTFLGEIARTRNELAIAEQYLQKGLALAQQGGLTDDVLMALGFLAWVKHDQGDADSAQQLFAQFVRLIQTYQVAWMIQRAIAHRARLDLMQGRLAAAVEWARSYQEMRAGQAAGYTRDVEDLTLVRVLLAEGKLRDARTILGEISAQTETGGRMRRVIEVKMLTALAFQREGRAAEAIHALRQAVTAAAPERWLRLFLDEGDRLAALLPHARDAAPAFVDELLALLSPATTTETAPASAHKPNALPISGETLSEREVEILGLLAEGLSNQEIGQALYIGVGTVKWYLTNLYDKLDVSNRTQAVARARDLGLLA